MPLLVFLGSIKNHKYVKKISFALISNLFPTLRCAAIWIVNTFCAAVTLQAADKVPASTGDHILILFVVIPSPLEQLFHLDREFQSNGLSSVPSNIQLPVIGDLAPFALVFC